MSDKEKRKKGQWYTVRNPFQHPAFDEWFFSVTQRDLLIVEPFAGCANLVRMLPTGNWGGLYDIDPKSEDVVQRDSISDFPKFSPSGRRYGAVITNPPWLSLRRAKAQGISFQKTHQYDDLYKIALRHCLDNIGWVAAILPESFATSGLFVSRLHSIVSLSLDVFGGKTEHPSCLALFTPNSTGDPEMWIGNNFVGTLSSIRSHPVLQISDERVLKIRFYEPSGEIGIFAMDTRKGPTIRFVDGREIPGENVKRSSRHIVRVKLPHKINHRNLQILINNANSVLADFRQITCDLTLTAMRSRRRDGKYRRRLDFDIAARILTIASDQLK